MGRPDIKQHCCGADRLFDSKTAKKQYKSYLKKGASRVTKKLIKQLEQVGTGDTLLDVGGGIGAIQWWFLARGGKKSFGVDASTGYTLLAKDHAEKHGYGERTHFIVGDFTDKAAELPLTDHVTLDKVICCYPDMQGIIDLACSKAQRSVSLSYPMDGMIAQLFRGAGVLFMKLIRNPFRPYVHSVNLVRERFIANGFKRQEAALSFPWHLETYVKA